MRVLFCPYLGYDLFIYLNFFDIFRSYCANDKHWLAKYILLEKLVITLFSIFIQTSIEKFHLYDQTHCIYQLS